MTSNIIPRLSRMSHDQEKENYKPMKSSVHSRPSENASSIQSRKNVQAKTSEHSTRRHLSVRNGNKNELLDDSQDVTEVNKEFDLSADNSVFDETSKISTTKDSLSKLRKASIIRSTKTSTICPPAGAILLRSPPEDQSTPPFPNSRTRVVSFKSPPVTLLEFRCNVSVLPPPGVINIDLDNEVYEYAAEVIDYLTTVEVNRVLARDYLDQSGISESMRSILVDWIIQVQHYLNLCQETLYNAVAILDTVLARREVDPDKLQLVGIAALLVASKLEEYYPADIKKLLHLTENSYTKSELLQMEMVLLDILSFQAYYPTPQHFLTRYTRAALRHCEPEFLKTCQLLVDCHLPHASHPCLAPSLLTAASVFTALLLYNVTNNEKPTSTLWTSTLRHHTSYQEEKLAPVSLSMLEMLLSYKFTGFRTKYKSQSKHDRLVKACHVQEEVTLRAKEALLEMVD